MLLLGVDIQWTGHVFDGGGGDRWSQVAVHFEVQPVELRFDSSISSMVVTQE